MIELRNIKKEYKIKKQKVQALQDISLILPNKGMVSILGTSGSGKSTLLNIIGGLDSYDSGEMFVDGKSTKTFNEKDYTRYRNSYVGFVFQEFCLIEEYTVYENIALVAKLQGKRKNKKEIQEILKKLGLEGYENRKIHELSGGQKQRVSLARILIKKPKIILADEPTGSLDSKTGKEVMELLKQISEEILVVLVTHNREYALEYASQIIEIEDGRIIKDTICAPANSKEEYTSKKSKLPFTELFRLGSKLLLHRKIKLVLSMLLLIISSILLNSLYIVYKYNVNENHLQMLKEEKRNVVEIRKKTGNMREEDISFLQNQVGNNVGVVYLNQNRMTFSSLFHTENMQGENLEEELQIIEMDKFLFENNFLGTIPLQEKEVVISTSLADKMIKYGVYDEKNNRVFPKNQQEILNKTYQFDQDYIRVVGIESDYQDKIYVKENFTHTLKGNIRIGLDTNNQYVLKIPQNKKMIQTIDYSNDKIEYYDGKNWKKTTKLEKNRVILNISDIMPDKLSYIDQLETYIKNHPFLKPYEAEKELIKQLDINKYIGMHGQFDIYENLDVYIDGKDVKSDKHYDVEVIGVTGFAYFDNQSTFLSKEILSDYDAFSYQKVGFLLPIEKIKLSKLGKQYTIYSHYLSNLNIFSEWIFEHKFLVDLLFALFFIFTLLLLIYFVSTYIVDSQKQIGILKALGAENKDIIKMFCIVLFVVILIIILVTILFSKQLLLLCNSYYGKVTGTNIHPFYMCRENYSFLLIYYISILWIVSLFSILRITKMKPIHAINKNI